MGARRGERGGRARLCRVGEGGVGGAGLRAGLGLWVGWQWGGTKG